ncbi:hypothetical protein SUGI_0797210 [Cryptomeria japonica]|nr:hypothetical protein SUGI_0797210 [Cryptomeria japonica]
MLQGLDNRGVGRRGGVKFAKVGVEVKVHRGRDREVRGGVKLISGRGRERGFLGDRWSRGRQGDDRSRVVCLSFGVSPDDRAAIPQREAKFKPRGGGKPPPQHHLETFGGLGDGLLPSNECVGLLGRVTNRRESAGGDHWRICILRILPFFVTNSCLRRSSLGGR